MEEVYGLQRGLCWKINLIWLHIMRVSWLSYTHNCTEFKFQTSEETKLTNYPAKKIIDV